MPPKMDPNQIKYVYVRVTGGEVPGASSLAPKVGPLGMSPKKVGDDIVKGPLTKALLLNAVYFKGSWASKFDKDASGPGTFRAPAGAMTVMLMNTRPLHRWYASSGSIFSIIEGMMFRYPSKRSAGSFIEP